MFKQITLLSALTFCLAFCCWVTCFGWIRDSDFALYWVQKQSQQDASVKSLAQTTSQNRKGVVKEIYFVQEDQSRLHYKIESESSILTLKPEGSRFDLIEKLEKMRCWMQEKIEWTAQANMPIQQMRYLEAKEGIYRYTAQEFLAQSVALSLYRIQGEQMPINLTPYKPFLQGIAQDISFSVTGKTPNFQAQHFKALLNQHNEDKL